MVEWYKRNQLPGIARGLTQGGGEGEMGANDRSG